MCWRYCTTLLVESSKALLNSLAAFPPSFCLNSPEHVWLCSNLGSEGANTLFEALSSLRNLTNIFFLQIYKCVLDHYLVVG